MFSVSGKMISYIKLGALWKKCLPKTKKATFAALMLPQMLPQLSKRCYINVSGDLMETVGVEPTSKNIGT